MTMRRIGYIATALAIALAATPMAHAKDIPSDGMTFDDAAAWLRDQGLEAKITTDGAGNKNVQTATGGIRFGVYLLDCSNDRCGSMQFAANWAASAKISGTRVNEWNRTKRWARAYLDGSNRLWVEFDADLTPGGTYELLEDEFATWKKTLDTVKTFFDIK
jgi:hypothetical protein